MKPKFSNKKVSFLDVAESKKVNVNRSNLKKGSILKSKGKKKEEEEEKVNIPIIKNKEKEVKKEIKIEEPINSKVKNMKNMPFDEYFRLTVQPTLEQGLFNIAMSHPSNPIKFLGNYLIEKSKNPDSTL